MIERKAGIIQDVWVTDDPKEERQSALKYATEDEPIEIRYWNGEVFP